MRRKVLRAVYQKPLTSDPFNPSEGFSCLVDLSQVMTEDHVSANDITYIPMRKVFLNPVAIVDLFSRHILSWQFSNSLETEFCLDTLEMALEGEASQRYSTPIKAVSSPQPTSWPGWRL